MKTTDTAYSRPAEISVACLDMHSTGEYFCEHTMPDYYPAIRKVVSVSARALPDSKYISDSKLEIGGTLAFSMLYIGEDGTLACVAYTTEYSQSFGIGEYDSGSAGIFVQSEAQSPQCRVLAPRSISLKARVNSHISADRRMNCEMNLCTEGSGQPDAVERRSIERLEKELTSRRRGFAFTTDSVSLNEETEEITPVCLHAEAVIKDVRAGDESASVKGNIEVNCLALTKEGIYKTLCYSLPFEKTVSAPGLTDGHSVGAMGRVASVSTIWENGACKTDAEYDLDLYYCTDETVCVCEDIYSTEYEIRSETGEIAPNISLCCKSFDVAVSTKSERKTAIAEGDAIIYWEAQAKADSISEVEGRLSYRGQCSFKVYIASEGDVKVEEFTCPIEQELECRAGDTEGECRWHTDAVAHGCTFRLCDDGIEVKCEVCVFLDAYKRTGATVLTEAVVGERLNNKARGSSIRICYPEKGRRIWDIAKEYKCSMSNTERINKTERKNSSDGTPLILF